MSKNTADTLDAAILLAQSFDNTKFEPPPGQNPKQGGRIFRRFGSYHGGRGRYLGGQQYGNNNHGWGNDLGGQGRNNGGRNGGWYGNGYPPAPTCYCCGQVGHLANKCNTQLTTEAPKN